MQDVLLQLEILLPALAAGILVLATHVPFGREVLQRGIIFLDLAIAQIAGLGVVIAGTFWIDSSETTSHWQQTPVAIFAAILGAMGLYQLRSLEVKIQEAIIGILFVLAASGSVLLLSVDPHGGERLKEMLVGQILWIQVSDLLLLAVGYGVILILWFGLRRRLGNWIFYPLFATTITLSTQVVGVYLVFASLIIPAVATLKQSGAVWRALLIGTLGYASGLLLSSLLDLPAGATIVWSLSLVAMANLLFSKLTRS